LGVPVPASYEGRVLHEAFLGVLGKHHSSTQPGDARIRVPLAAAS
jgi:hypothetical protein